METKELCKFLDDLIEASYQAKIFQKEFVQSILQTNELIKSKLIEGENLAQENTARSITIENLESENKLLREKFNVSDSDIEKFKLENDINEIDIKDFEDLSKHNSENGEPSKFKKRLAEEMAKGKK